MIGSTPMLLGHYRPLDSSLHHLDARSKLAPVLVVMILGLLTDSLLFYVVVLAGLVGGLLASVCTVRVIAGNFNRFSCWLAITFFLPYHVFRS